MDTPRPVLLCAATFAAICLAFASPAFGQCPVTADATAGVKATAEPASWRVGEPVTIRVAGAFETVTAACLDGQEALAATRTADKSTTVVTLTIPKTDARPALLGDHTIVLSLSDANKNVSVVRVASSIKPTITSVKFVPLSKDERLARIRLQGSGFYQPLAANYRLLIDGRTRQACWTEDQCKLVSQAVAVSVEGEDSVVLSRIDLAKEDRGGARLRFQLCYFGQCSDTVEDVSGEEASDFVRLWASVAVIAIIGLVFLLARARVEDDMFKRKYSVTALFLDKETGTYSLSKLQFYLWTTVAIFSYAYLYLSRMWFQSWADLPPLPAGLPGIVAIAGGATVGAQVITQINGPKGSGEVHPRLSDFISSGGMVTAERVQFFVWTIVGSASFLIAVFRLDPRTLIELPSVPESLLAISGVSAFGYLGGKLARSAGPVLNEVIIRTGPDPDLVASTQSGQGAPAAVTTAAAAVQAAKVQLGALTQTQPLQGVFAAANTAMTAAEAAVAAAQPPAGSPVDKAKVKAQLEASEKALADATKQMLSLKTTGTLQAADLATGDKVVAAADSAVKAVDVLEDALNTATQTTTGGGTQTGGSPAGTKFGILELRGRTLSQDATFHLSKAESSAADDVKVTFDMLEPAPDDKERRQRPRIIARDDDAGTDQTLAKHLRLVIRLNETLAPIFKAGTKHTVTVKNPDSQSVAYPFDVKKEDIL